MATPHDRRVVSLKAAFFVACALAAGLLAPRVLSRYPVRFLLIAVRVVLLLPAALSAASGRFGRRATDGAKPSDLSSKLRRDLHDGLGPAVTAAAMRIETARRLFAEDPRAADVLLAQAHAELHDAISHMREILHELTPRREPRGQALGEALRDLAVRFQQASGGRLEILVNSSSLPRLTPNVKYAAYYIVSEAVTNVARHSGATRCTICITRSAQGICLNIFDNGIGLPAEPACGIGLLSMRERAIELGGDCSIRRRPSGGTQVLAHIPFSRTRSG